MPIALFTPTFLYMTAGLVVWAVRFLAVYSFAGLACARAWADGMANPIVLFMVATAAIGIGICAAVALHARSRLRRNAAGVVEGDRFIHATAALVAGIAALAIAWETVPAFFVPACS
jgi:hypothetical protein